MCQVHVYNICVQACLCLHIKLPLLMHEWNAHTHTHTHTHKPTFSLCSHGGSLKVCVIGVNTALSVPQTQKAHTWWNNELWRCCFTPVTHARAVSGVLLQGMAWLLVTHKHAYTRIISHSSTHTHTDTHRASSHNPTGARKWKSSPPPQTPIYATWTV